ncbi:MAG: type II toxin-antitoxin system HicB family antitoxin [Planctomycetes bacterium]|nr:type II toxin-antitoxin system HicB family antitoxin [Planctomycetota bacterium]
MKLYVKIEQDEKGYFVAEVPALPGCLSQGKTKQDAIKNIREAVAGWLEVMEEKARFNHKKAIAVNL